jgi:hypothetical protein
MKILTILLFIIIVNERWWKVATNLLIDLRNELSEYLFGKIHCAEALEERLANADAR